MRILKLLSLVVLMVSLTATASFAQRPEEPKTTNTTTNGEATPEKTESSEPDPDFKKPLDGVVEKKHLMDHPVLPYDQVREADLMWEKRVWRIIDVREKMNLCFSYPEEYFFSIINEAAIKGDLKAYSVKDDKFSLPLTKDEVASMSSSIDTISVFDPETYEENIKIVRNERNPDDVKQFRVKEIWFFDKETSTMQVRILGIAPLIDEYDNNGNFKYTRPLYWLYYPDCRELLARHRVFNIGGNDASPMSWEDLFEMRFFSSYVYKESNVFDRKIEEYATGVDQLMEGEKIKQEIFNFEHDLWSY